MTVRRDVNEYIVRNYTILQDTADKVERHLDFEDGFWWTEDVTTFSQNHARPAPPILCVLASSWNMAQGSTTCDFWRLLRMSRLTPDRQTEATTYPVLYHAKLLLRHTLFYDLQRPNPVVRSQATDFRPGSDEVDRSALHQTLYQSMTGYLQAFENATRQQGLLGPGESAALIFSLCLFSVVKTILSDQALQVPQTAPGTNLSNAPAAMHSVYRALVSLLIWSRPMGLEASGSENREEDRGLLDDMSILLRQVPWANRDSRDSTPAGALLSSFGEPENSDSDRVQGPTRLLCKGFIRPLLRAKSEPFALPPLKGSGDEPRKPLPDTRLGVLRGPNEMLPKPIYAERQQPYVFGGDNTAMSTSPQAFATEPGRRHTVAGESPSFTMGVSRGPTSPVAAHRLSQSYPRPPLPRAFCQNCNDHPEGFRGEHELRRHNEAKHKQEVKRWICAEAQNGGLNAVKPVVPLSKCKACTTRKKYGAYYNAAAHLRRTHFNPQKGGKASGDWPPMSVLKDWMKEVIGMRDQDQDDSSGAEDQEMPDYRLSDDKPDYRSPTGRASPPYQQYSATGSAPSSSSSGLAPVLPSQTLLSQAAQAIHNSQAYSQPHTPATLPPRTLLPPIITPSYGNHPAPSPYQFSFPPPQPWSSRPSPSQESAVHTPSSQLSSGPAGGPRDHRHHHHSLHPLDMSSLTTLPGSMINSNAAGGFEDGPRIEIIPARSFSSSGGRNTCPRCGRAMKDLQAHMLTHLDERPEKCPIETCEFHIKGFARKYDKNRHTLIHYKGNMICPFCPGVGTEFAKGFNRVDVFKKHLMKSHGVEQTPPNSRKNPLASGGGTAGHNGSIASCSICRSQFSTAQAFYEHLDECIFSQVLSTVPQETNGTGADNDGGTRTSSISGPSGGLKNPTVTTMARTTAPAHVGREPDQGYKKHDRNGGGRRPMEGSHPFTDDSTPNRPSTGEEGVTTQQDGTVNISGTTTGSYPTDTAVPNTANGQKEAPIVAASPSQRTPERMRMDDPSDHRAQLNIKRESQPLHDEAPQPEALPRPPSARKALPSAPGQREENVHSPPPSLSQPSSLESQGPTEEHHEEDPTEPPTGSHHQPTPETPVPPEDKTDVDT